MSRTPTKCLKLLEVTEEEKNAIYAEIGITESEFWELRRKAMEYIDQSEHLPKDYDAALLNGFVFNNKARLEQGKRFLDHYCRIKNDYADCLFDHAVPDSKRFQDCIKYSYNICTRKLLPAPYCHRVQIFKFNDPEGKADNAFVYMIALVMMCEIRGTYDYHGSTVVVCDMEHLTIHNVLKFSPHWAFAVKDMLENISLRISGFHFINNPPILEKVLVIFKSILTAKLKDRIYIHTSYEDLRKAIPKQCLPKDYGGCDKSIQELHEDWIEATEELKPYFEKCRAAKGLKKYDLDEDLRESLGIGVDGSFKKLAID